MPLRRHLSLFTISIKILAGLLLKRCFRRPISVTSIRLLTDFGRLSNNLGNHNSMIVTHKVRLDKWLWAARFFKTRAKAKAAIDGGKVHIDGIRGKAAKELQIGLEIRLRQGWDEKTVIIKSLSDQRRNATIAETLYEETTISIEQRLLKAAQRKSAGQQSDAKERPSKRNRRLIHQFKDKNLNAE